MEWGCKGEARCCSSYPVTFQFMLMIMMQAVVRLVGCCLALTLVLVLVHVFVLSFFFLFLPFSSSSTLLRLGTECMQHK